MLQGKNLHFLFDAVPKTPRLMPSHTKNHNAILFSFGPSVFYPGIVLILLAAMPHKSSSQSGPGVKKHSMLILMENISSNALVRVDGEFQL